MLENMVPLPMSWEKGSKDSRVHGELFLPLNRNPDPLFCFVHKEEITMFPAKKKKIPGNGHILFAIFNNFIHSTLFPPLEGLKAIGTFLNPESGPGQMIQGEPEP
jgi:hypothetical protein